MYVTNSGPLKPQKNLGVIGGAVTKQWERDKAEKSGIKAASSVDSVVAKSYSKMPIRYLLITDNFTQCSEFSLYSKLYHSTLCKKAE